MLSHVDEFRSEHNLDSIVDLCQATSGEGVPAAERGSARVVVGRATGALRPRRRLCERSEAIQSLRAVRLGCFAALAKTGWVLIDPVGPDRTALHHRERPHHARILMLQHVAMVEEGR